MSQYYTIDIVFRILLVLMVKTDDPCLVERILFELGEMATKTMNISLLLFIFNYYSTKLASDNDDLSKQLFTFIIDEECQATLGFCSCIDYIDAVLIDGRFLTCEHELIISIMCYCFKSLIKAQNEMDSSTEDHKSLNVEGLGLRKFIKLLKGVCTNYNDSIQT